MQTFYLGLSNTYHDSALAIVDEQGTIIFAEATERSLQNKQAIDCVPDRREIIEKTLPEFCPPDSKFIIARTWSNTMALKLKIGYLLNLITNKRTPQTSEATAFKNMMKGTVGWGMGAGTAMLHSQSHTGQRLYQFICEHYGKSQAQFINYPHHLTHAANACYTSPFQDAACVIIDGMGEASSLSYFYYENGIIKRIKKNKNNCSLGIIYEICTYFCGFHLDRGEEWKLMGLAPYGQLDPEFLGILRNLVDVNGLSIQYSSIKQIEVFIDTLIKISNARTLSPMKLVNLAYTTQFFYIEIVNQLLGTFHAMVPSKNIVIGGGCALNSSYNGKILEHTPFKHLYVPSAPADDGNAIGAALLAYHNATPASHQGGHQSFQTPYLGSCIAGDRLDHFIQHGHVEHLRHLPKTICQETAKLLAQGKLVAWVQGRAEFGPRALGNRSLLAAPYPAKMKDKINAVVKFREGFRPFAPSILHEFGHQYFEHYQESPYMERALTFRDQVIDKVPAVVHANQTGRLQTVKPEWNPRFYALIKSFYDLVNIPLLLNTSFNVMGKPIVHSIEDAVGMFYTTGIDVLVIGDYLIEKGNR